MENRTAKWSQKYKDSIDCDNPKGFSQRAHCQGRKKKQKMKKSDVMVTLNRLAEEMENKGLEKQASELHEAFLRIAEHLHDDEPVVESDYDHELGMIRNQLKNMQRAIDNVMDVIGEHGEGNLPAWVQAMISVSADDLDSVSDYMASEYGHTHGHGMEKEASAHEEDDHHENVDDVLDPDYWMEAESSLEDALNNYDAHLYKVDAAGDWNLGKLMEIKDFVQMITRKDEEAMSAPAIVDGNHIVFKVGGMDPQVINLVHADHWDKN